MFDVTTGEERPAAEIRSPVSEGRLWARVYVLAQLMVPRSGTMSWDPSHPSKSAYGFISKGRFLGKEQESPMDGVKIADGPGAGHLS